MSVGLAPDGRGAEQVPHRLLLRRLARDLGPVAARVAHDVGERESTVRPAVELVVQGLLESDELTERSRFELHAEGERAARDEVPLSTLLDRYLSTGWVLLEAAAEASSASSGAEQGDERGDAGTGGMPSAVAPEVIAQLGAVLLKAGDTAAAALSNGYGRVARERAARSATARAGCRAELRGRGPAAVAGLARAPRHASQLGLDPAAERDVFVASLPARAAGLDQDQALEEAARRVPPPPRAGQTRDGPDVPLVAIHRGLLLVLAPRGGRTAARIAASVAAAGADGWLVVRSEVRGGLGGVAGAWAEAVEALEAARATGIGGRIVEAPDLLLERALLAGGRLTREAVAREIGALQVAARGGEALVATLRAYLESGQNVRAAARALGIAPRTVSYRLARAERLLGRRLDGAGWIRLAAALFAYRLIGQEEAAAADLAGTRRPGLRKGD